MEKIIFHKMYTLYGCIPEIGEIYRFINKKVKKINGNIDNGNYTQLCLSLKGKRKYIGAHRFIWECVNGDIPDGFEIDHINSVRDDNRIENLRCVTMAENRKYASAKRTDNIRSIAHKLRRNIKAINANDETETYCFTSKSQCTKFFNISSAGVYLICEHKNNYKRANTTKGYFTFTHIDNIDNENVIKIPDKRLNKE